MFQFKFYELDFVSPFTKLDSIKIESAVLAKSIELYPEKKDEILEWFKDGDIAFSEPFPIKENQPLIIFPKVPIKIKSSDNMKWRKKLKKYITFEKLDYIINNYNENNFLILDDFINLNKSDKDLIEEKDQSEQNFNSFEDEIGVNIYREPVKREDKLIFNEVYTKEYESEGLLTIDKQGNKTGINFWIAVQIEDQYPEKYKIVNTALKLLSDIGISGRKSVGRGYFNIKSYSTNKDLGFKGEGLYYLLSKFIPNENEFQKIDFKKSLYSFDIFSGSDKKNHPLGIYRYFVPGSILYLKENVKGRSVILDLYERIIPFQGIFMKVGKNELRN